MGRLTLLILVGLLITAAAPLSAELLVQYQDEVSLRDHETARYRINLDYGTSEWADVDVTVRGFNAPPRVRILEVDYDEIKDVRDTDGDWTVEPDFIAHDYNSTYYIEVDSANPNAWGDFEITITVSAPDGAGADATVSFVKYYFDYESGDESDHYDCAVNAGAGSWPLAGLALLASVAIWRRRRVTLARARE
ncbi:MAG: MYXO-CTERM sorting domain-containing protein [Planctomycetota bacterium]|nr:MYXO-CTERM sorting domain-containing protein [Planctomycetota bacterium]